MITCTFEDGSTGNLRHLVVDSIVMKDGKILLAKRTSRKIGVVILEGGKWSLVGGYVRMGERATYAAAREIREETGWKVTDINLFMVNDNPDRPHEDRQNVSLVFVATATEKVGGHDNENSDIKWFSLDDLPPAREMAFDHLEVIEAYKRHLKDPSSRSL